VSSVQPSPHEVNVASVRRSPVNDRIVPACDCPAPAANTHTTAANKCFAIILKVPSAPVSLYGAELS
jgi:hypothetical protein